MPRTRGDAVVSHESLVTADDSYSVEAVFDSVFGERPDDRVLDLLRPIQGERQEVRDFLARWLQLSAAAGIGPRDISPGQAWNLGVLIPGLLPGAWGNVIPPFTVEDRHRVSTR